MNTGDTAMKTNIRLETVAPGVAKILFDQQGSAANVFSRSMLEELNRVLDEVEKMSDLKGVVLASAKDSIFIAGLDLKEIAGDHDVASLRSLIELGQATFNRIAELKVRTVAAIHGAALGGGCEITLACDVRIASPDRKTSIGLPETSLGILPAWGGCARLPRLIGLPAALDIILNGKKLNPWSARKKGLVDQLVPREHFDRIALGFLSAPPRRKSHWLVNNPLSAAVIRQVAGRTSQAKTRGHYPAIPRALDVVVRGLRGSIKAAEKLELQAVLELSGTAACRSLLGIFFLQDRAKRLKADRVALVDASLHSQPPPDIRKLNRCMVVGAGTMGAGIAQWLAARGYKVLLKDINPEAVCRGMAHAGQLYEEAARRRIFTAAEARRGMERILPVTTNVPLDGVGLVIEAVVEDIEIKKKVFGALDAALPPDAVLATNTSALPVGEIAAATGRPDRVIGLHFFNPVHRMQLVEIVVAGSTSVDTVSFAISVVQKMGKLPVVVKDRPGFLVNRILMPYLVEAGLLYAGGAGAGTIDRIMLEYGMPMGPLRLLDEVGNDVALHVAGFLNRSFGERMPVPPILGAMAQAKLLGKKSGEGFYSYRGGKTKPGEAAARLVSERSTASLSPRELQDRMVLPMLNEAARCLEEGIVGAPEDIDLAMIMGTGFAPFRGGPMRVIDTLGAGTVVGALEKMAERAGERYRPCDLLREQADKATKFYSPGKAGDGGTP